MFRAPPMSWLTIVYAMAAAASLTLGILHLLVWFQRREAKAWLLFSIGALAVGVDVLAELSLARTTSHAPLPNAQAGHQTARVANFRNAAGCRQFGS